MNPNSSRAGGWFVPGVTGLLFCAGTIGWVDSTFDQPASLDEGQAAQVLATVSSSSQATVVIPAGSPFRITSL